MKDNSGKVILALLAGASAGIVAGLLMAPEAGTATRETWGKSLGKFGDDLNKLLQDGLSKLDALKGGASDSGEDASADRSGAEDALAGMGGGASGGSTGRSGKSGGSKTGNAGNSGNASSQSSSGGQTSSGAGSSAPASGDAGASTASSSRTTGSEAGESAGGTTGGSGVGS